MSNLSSLSQEKIDSLSKTILDDYQHQMTAEDTIGEVLSAGFTNDEIVAMLRIMCFSNFKFKKETPTTSDALKETAKECSMMLKYWDDCSIVNPQGKTIHGNIQDTNTAKVIQSFFQDIINSK